MAKLLNVADVKELTLLKEESMIFTGNVRKSYLSVYINFFSLNSDAKTF